MAFKRPDNIPFPTVWDRFQGKVLVDGKLLNYVIQDVTDDLIEPVVDHMCTYFLVREVMTSSDGLLEDEVSLKEIREFWRELLKRRMGLVALVEGEGDPAKRIAGCNMTVVVQKDDPSKTYKGKQMVRLVRSLAEFYKNADIFQNFGVDKFLHAVGLSVAPKYQGDGVGIHILRARDPLCQSMGIPVAVTLFSSLAAIHEALKVGYKVVIDTTYDKFKLDGTIAYPRLKSRVVLTVKLIPPKNH